MKHRRPGWCGWCDKAIESTNGKPTRRSWHPECVLEFKKIHHPEATRAAVFDRDNGICARCGIDCEKDGAERKSACIQNRTLQRALGGMEMRQRFPSTSLWRYWSKPGYKWLHKQMVLLENERGWPHEGASFWQHDHIRPLIEANGDITFWQLDNIQTLCHRCHVIKGKEDNARRRAQKAQ